MIKDIWLNLPVKNVSASVDFFRKLGFEFNEARTNEHAACMYVGAKKFIIMLFNENTFKSFIQADITDTTKGNEMLLSFDAESKEEVDAFHKKCVDAQANIFSKPQLHQGWMYGFAFLDLDGHRWNLLYMDMSKMPQ